MMHDRRGSARSETEVSINEVGDKKTRIDAHIDSLSYEFAWPYFEYKT
jgi:hypothetical protein